MKYIFSEEFVLVSLSKFYFSTLLIWSFCNLFSFDHISVIVICFV